MSAPELFAKRTPCVSVVIPTRNCFTYLPRALESVTTQMVPDIEIIVVDDGSTDETAEWLAKMRRTDPRLVVLTGNGDGPNVSRNRAIAAAQAPLVAFLDADDVWFPGKLAAQLSFHAADREAVFSFNDSFVDNGGREYGTAFEYWWFRRTAAAARKVGGDGYRRLDRACAHILAENVVGTSTVVAKRSALQNASGFDASIRSASDWDLWLRLSRMGPVGFSPAVGTRYLMQRPGCVSGNIDLRNACMRQILNTHARFVPEPRFRSRASATMLIAEADAASSQGRAIAALKYAIRSFLKAASKRGARLSWVIWPL